MGRRVRWSLAAFVLYASGGFLAALWHQPYYAVVTLLIVMFASLFFFGDSEYATRLALQPEDVALRWVLLNPVRWPSMGLRTARSLRSSHEADQYFILLFSFSSVLLLVLPDVYRCIWNRDVQNVETLLAAWAPALLLPLVAQLAWHSWFLRKKDRVKGIHYGPFRQSKAIQEHLAMVRKLVRGDVQRRARCCRGCCRFTSQSAVRDRQLHDLFESMEAGVLSDVLMGLGHTDTPLQHILYSVRDREALVELLGVRRVHQLSLPAKSLLLNAFMFLRLQSCPALERAVEALLLSTAGDDLSELKSRQDAGNSQSMHRLLFQDITDLEVRQRLLDHFLCEAQAQVAQRALLRSPHFSELLRMGRARGCVPQHLKFVDQLRAKYQGSTRHAWMKIISDIDDTVECSGNKWPAGIDTRYPRHTTYPGVTAFFRELQGGGEVGHLVLLSARPHICGSLMEQRIFKKFAKKGEDSFFCQPAVLPGDLVSGADFVLNGSMQALADRKFRNFEKYFRIYPEFRFVFLGDNGQADFEVGKRMCKEFGRHIEQVWIHRVQAEEQTFGYSTGAETEGPLNFFSDYVDAAVHACSRPEPLISLEGLARVVEGARADFSRIRWSSDADRERERERLNSSIERANTLLTTLCCQRLLLIEEVDGRDPPFNGSSDVGSDCCSDGDSHHPHSGFFDSVWRGKASRAPEQPGGGMPLEEGQDPASGDMALAEAHLLEDADAAPAAPAASAATAPAAPPKASAAAEGPHPHGAPGSASAGLQSQEQPELREELHPDPAPALERRGSGSMLGGIWPRRSRGLPGRSSATLVPVAQVATPGEAAAAAAAATPQLFQPPTAALGALEAGTPASVQQSSDAVPGPNEATSTSISTWPLAEAPPAPRCAPGDDALPPAAPALHGSTPPSADASAAASASASASAGPTAATTEQLDTPPESLADRTVAGSVRGFWQSTRTILQRRSPDEALPSPPAVADAGRVHVRSCSPADNLQDMPPAAAPEAEVQCTQGSRISEIWYNNLSRLRLRSPEDSAAETAAHGQLDLQVPEQNPAVTHSNVNPDAGLIPENINILGESAVASASEAEHDDAPPAAGALNEQAWRPTGETDADKRGAGSMFGELWKSGRTILQRKAQQGVLASPSLTANPAPKLPPEQLEALPDVCATMLGGATPEPAASQPEGVPHSSDQPGTPPSDSLAANPSMTSEALSSVQTPARLAGQDRVPLSPSALQWFRAQSSRAGRMASRPRHDHAHVAAPLPQQSEGIELDSSTASSVGGTCSAESAGHAESASTRSRSGSMLGGIWSNRRSAPVPELNDQQPAEQKEQKELKQNEPQEQRPEGDSSPRVLVRTGRMMSRPRHGVVSSKIPHPGMSSNEEQGQPLPEGGRSADSDSPEGKGTKPGTGVGMAAGTRGRGSMLGGIGGIIQSTRTLLQRRSPEEALASSSDDALELHGDARAAAADREKRIGSLSPARATAKHPSLASSLNLGLSLSQQGSCKSKARSLTAPPHTSCTPRLGSPREHCEVLASCPDVAGLLHTSSSELDLREAEAPGTAGPSDTAEAGAASQAEAEAEAEAEVEVEAAAGEGRPNQARNPGPEKAARGKQKSPSSCFRGMWQASRKPQLPLEESQQLQLPQQAAAASGVQEPGVAGEVPAGVTD